MRFADIPTHLQLKERLIYLAKNNQVPHAHLFWGAPGSASLSLALAFATYLNCYNRLEDSCGKCASCIKSDKLIHPDIKFVFPINTKKTSSEQEITSNNFIKLWNPFIQEHPYKDISDWSHYIGAENKQLIIPKAEAKSINRYISSQPFEGAYKIIVIWLPEYLHPNAANAMLKTLEDPPLKTIFLLVSVMPEKLISPLRSRLQQIYIPAFDDETIRQIILQHHDIPPQKLAQIVGLSEGNLNKAYKLLQENKNDFFEEFKNWMRACYAQDFTKLMKHVDKFQEIQKENQKHFLKYVLYMFRNITLTQFASHNLVKAFEQELQLAEKLGQILNTGAIKNISILLNQAYYHIDRNLNPKVLFLNLSLKIVQIFQDIRQKAA